MVNEAGNPIIENAPTVVAVEDFDPEADAITIHGALTSSKHDKDCVIELVVSRSWKQLKNVEWKYKAAFGRDLKEDLESCFGGDFEDVVVARFLTPAEVDAKWLRSAMKGMKTNKHTLCHIICTKTNTEIEATKESYWSLFKRDLEEDVINATNGDLKHLLVALLQAKREVENDVDEGKATNEAQELVKADGAVFNRIFSLRSFTHLRAIFNAFTENTEMDIVETIKEMMSGKVQEAYLMLIQWLRDPIFFYANALLKSMEGVGTDDSILKHIILTRCEVDLVAIKDRYKKLYADVGMGNLDHWLIQDTSGDYRQVLRKLCATIEE